MRQAALEYITGAWTVVVVVVFAAKIKQSVTQMTDVLCLFFSEMLQVFHGLQSCFNRAQKWRYVTGH